ncbi:MAG TPA: branched-chain amino acid ABC transporter ATP-binding protein [Acidimicrobiaceae bacterium]|nr:branched-chain amino acid ABC transporter ATP-binding protein [Acidimicrobiaceae bacterium]HCV35041.1 branched-chain amino acid ABC transporter ATP-binding protein [Acidimicrobiaceae bacterium]
MLEVESLTTRYGAIAAIREVGLTVRAGEVVCLIGPNGAGKTTLLATVAGLLKASSGKISLDDDDITDWAPDRILRSGLALVPEHRRIFADLTVNENLLVGGVTRTGTRRAELRNQVVDLFPALSSKLQTSAGYLSGGEAQQLAIGRAMMAEPQLLLLDEPTLGLSPKLADVVFDLIGTLRSAGLTLLVVEQSAQRILEVADRGYVLRSGEVVASGLAPDLLARQDLFETYLGRNVDST